MPSCERSSSLIAPSIGASRELSKEGVFGRALRRAGMGRVGGMIYLTLPVGRHQ